MTERAGTDVVAAVDELCAIAERIAAGGPSADRVADVVARFHGPLRVAIAGRVKAGKSTLLNALVGERLAATDAGECTRLVTLFQHASGYEVSATLDDGTTKPLTFRRDDGALSIDLGDLGDRVEHLEVGWPSRTLGEITLIDTPGLASLNDENSERTRAFLDHDGSNPANADAVIYLMRHLHRSDADFLGSFMDRSVAGASPVNAVAVLSRSDEIGACRLDAMESAGRIADRYGSDPDVRALVGDVVAVAGLAAETGLTLREVEYAQLAELAAMPEPDRIKLLLSVDDFCDVNLSPLTGEIRRDLLERFGMFGARLAIGAIADGTVDSARSLAALLVDRSGLAELQRVIGERFLPRARLLKARTALVALRGIAAKLTADGHPEAAAFAGAVDRADASALEFAVLQAAHLVLSGSVTLTADGAAEVDRALSDPDLAAAFDLTELDAEQRQAIVLGGISRWRELAADPIAGPLEVTVADTMARVYERLHASS